MMNLVKWLKREVKRAQSINSRIHSIRVCDDAGELENELKARILNEVEVPTKSDIDEMREMKEKVEEDFVDELKDLLNDPDEYKVVVNVFDYAMMVYGIAEYTCKHEWV